MDFDALADGRQTIDATQSPCASPSVQMYGNGWNKERRQRVAELWANPAISGSQIAAIVGGGLTRNAVIAYCNRLIKHGYLKPRGPNRPVRNKIPRDEPWLRIGISKTTYRRWRRNGGPPKREARKSKIKQILATPESPTEPMRLIPLAELTSNTCRYPVGDNAPYLFCGLEPAHLLPYCQHHCRITYRVPA